MQSKNSFIYNLYIFGVAVGPFFDEVVGVIYL